MNITDHIHGKYVYGRRVRVLTEELAAITPRGARVLDVGCGDGLIARLVGERRPDLETQGIDVLVREQTHVPVAEFDGRAIPYPDKSFDVVRFVDVLHHTDDPAILLREAARVARHSVIIKDHTRDGLLAGPTLRLMDWVGNARHGVVLPYNYWPERRWREAFKALGLRASVWKKDLGLYAPPFGLLFDRSLHFVARLEPEGA